MNKECEIVQDLLFGYNDGTLRKSSKELVEGHLRKCNECKQILEEIQKESSKLDETMQIDGLKKVNRRLKIKTIVIYVSLILLALIILFNAWIFVDYYSSMNLIDENKIVVYLNKDISEEQIQNIEETLNSKYSNIKINYVSPEEAFSRMVDKLGQNMPETYKNAKNPLSKTLEITVFDNNIEEIIQNVQKMQGVKNVVKLYAPNPYEWFIIKNFM